MHTHIPIAFSALIYIMGDSARCAYYKRSIIYGCSSGYEHQIIDFFDPLEATKNTIEMKEKSS